MKHLGNVCEIDGSKIEKVDVITFGAPCQDEDAGIGGCGAYGEKKGNTR